MPFTLADLDRIRVRVGMGTKSLREISDTQFTAWLRAQGARGEIGGFDPRVNMRASIHGAIELVEQLRGAFEHGLRQHSP